MATRPQESAYPHLWRDAVLLLAPGLGDQGRRLYDWSLGTTKGLARGASVSTSPPGHPFILQTTTAGDRLWIPNLGAGRTGNIQTCLSIGVPTPGATQVVVPHHDALNLVNSGTLMCWARMDVNASGQLLSKGNENYYFQILTTGNIFFEWNNGGFRNLQFAVPEFTLGRWYHYAVTWNNLRMTAYRNGEPLAAPSTMSANLVANTSDVTLHYSPNFGNQFRGCVDDVRIYTRACSPEEVRESYAVDLAPYRLKPRFQVFRATESMGVPVVNARYAAQMTSITTEAPSMFTPPPVQAQYQAKAGAVGRAPATAPGQSQYQAQTPIITNSLRVPAAQVKYAAQMAMADRTAMVTPSRSQYRAQTPRISIGILSTPSRIQYQVQAPVPAQALQVPPVRGIWYPAMVEMQGVTLIAGSQVKAQYQVQTPIVMLRLMATPGRAQWQAQTPSIPLIVMAPPTQTMYQVLAPTVGLEIPERDYATEYQLAFTNPAVTGDWLIQFPVLGLNFSFGYNPDGTWIHRIITLSDIELSAPPGGGITLGSNVTISMAESDAGANLLFFWNLYTVLQGAEVTIKFLLEGQPLSSAFQVFTGYVDKVTIGNGVSEFLCVDRSIQRNRLLPRELITIEEFPNANPSVLNRPKPIVYGSGTYPPFHPNTNTMAAPLALVDIPNNIYLLANHDIAFNDAHLSIYDNPNDIFLPLDNTFVTSINGLVTLAISDLGTQAVYAGLSMGVTNPSFAVDGISTTFAIVDTSIADSNGDGIGVLHVTPTINGYPNTTTVQITLARHQRGPISDPTTTATFVFQTLDSRTLFPAQVLFSAGPFNHLTSAQTNVYVLSNVLIPAHEIFDVYMLVRQSGMVGGVSNVYHIGEISIAPLIAYTGATSTATALIANAIPLQNIRFNYLQPPLFVEWQQGVANATNAVDGNVSTLALVGTTVLDSNLDGIGELILANLTTSAQRANNTMVINFLNHRRNVSSAPTLTGTFSLQTLHPVRANSAGPAAILRNNLFTTQSFRHATNARNTSFTVPSINLGATERVGIRILARDEGGIGSGTQTYEIGEVTLESFYQPSGDSQNLFLFGTNWSGRTDTTGVLSYKRPSVPLGTLYHYADEVMASILVEETGLELDADFFYYASLFYRTVGWFFDGGIGVGWAIERANARQILDDLAKQMACLLFPLYTGGWGIRAYGQGQSQIKIFDVSNILLEDSETSQVLSSQNLRSSFQLNFGSLESVHSRFEVHYAYNPGNNQYGELLYADHLSTNSPDGTVLTNQCAQAFNHYGALEPYVIEAYWINDSVAARYLLRHVVTYFSDIRLMVEFDVPIRYINLVIGEPIRIIYPFLPSSECDNGVESHGAVFETHGFRISPTTGRIHITASKKKITSP